MSSPARTVPRWRKILFSAFLIALVGAILELGATWYAALTVAYFSFVNRLVLALGVEVEEDYASTCKAADE